MSFNFNVENKERVDLLLKYHKSLSKQLTLNNVMQKKVYEKLLVIEKEIDEMLGVYSNQTH